MPLNLFYTMVEKKSKMTKNSNQGGPALSLVWFIFFGGHPPHGIQSKLFKICSGKEGLSTFSSWWSVTK